MLTLLVPAGLYYWSKTTSSEFKTAGDGTEKSKGKVNRKRKKLTDNDTSSKLSEALIENPVNPKKRIFGLHQGKIWMSDDFNQPLPDNFWNFDS